MYFIYVSYSRYKHVICTKIDIYMFLFIRCC